MFSTGSSPRVPARARRGTFGAARAAGLLGVTVATVGALSGCSIERTFDGFGWPRHGVTEQAHQMYDLWIGSVIAALVVGFFVWGLIFWCVVRYRKRGDEMPPQVRYNLPMETLYTITPFLIIAVLFYYTSITDTVVNRTDTKNPPAVQVEVVAFQWNWQFVYQGQTDDTGQQITTTGTPDLVPVLVVPTHERIRLIENSRDVVHSFWVPDMLFKRDVIPGVTNQFEVTVDREGAYVGRCAELCGTYHAMMNFEVRAVTRAQYDQYLALRRGGATSTEALATILPDTRGLATTTFPFPAKAQVG